MKQYITNSPAAMEETTAAVDTDATTNLSIVNTSVGN